MTPLDDTPESPHATQGSVATTVLGVSYSIDKLGPDIPAACVMQVTRFQGESVTTLHQEALRCSLRGLPWRIARVLAQFPAVSRILFDDPEVAEALDGVVGHRGSP